MAFNPGMMFKIKGAWERFVQNHPKFPMFLRAAAAAGIKEGYIIEVRSQIQRARPFVPM